MTDNKQLFNQPDANPEFQEKNIDKLENQPSQAQTDVCASMFTNSRTRE